MFIIQVSRDGWPIGFASPALKVASFPRAKFFDTEQAAELFARRLVDCFPRVFRNGNLMIRVLPLDSALRMAA